MEKILLVDFLDREGNPNRLSLEKIRTFGGSRCFYGWKELAAQQIDRELDIKLRKERYIIYQDFDSLKRKKQ
ncbi:MAG: hypothetical protein ABIH28_03265 [archaeon]